MKMHFQVLPAHLVLFLARPYSVSVQDPSQQSRINIRNRPVPLPLAPRRFSICLDRFAVTQQRRTSWVVLNALYSLVKLSRLAVRGEDVEV
jgi:hypothetical protein